MLRPQGMDSPSSMGHWAMQAFHDFRTLNLNYLESVCIGSYILGRCGDFLVGQEQIF